MLKSYIYPAIVSYDEDAICLEFVDFPEGYTDGQNDEEVLKNAVEVLKLTLRGRLDDKEEIPSPSIKDIPLEDNQKLIYVSVEMDDKAKYVKKTLTIPEDLNNAAQVAGINFSKVLREALLKELSNVDK